MDNGEFEVTAFMAEPRSPDDEAAIWWGSRRLYNDAAEFGLQRRPRTTDIVCNALPDEDDDCAMKLRAIHFICEGVALQGSHSSPTIAHHPLCNPTITNHQMKILSNLNTGKLWSCLRT